MTYPGLENDAQTLATNPDMAAVLDRRREREEEYGAWVATQDIPWGTVLAHTAGDRVPASTVDRLKWNELGLVVKRDSTEGREVLERTNTATTEERDRWAEQDKARAAREREQSKAAETEEAPAKTTSKATAKGGSN
jgi:hypothetical protein